MNSSSEAYLVRPGGPVSGSGLAGSSAGRVLRNRLKPEVFWPEMVTFIALDCPLDHCPIYALPYSQGN